MLSEGEHRHPLNHTKRLGNLQFLGYLKSHPDTVHTAFSIEKFLESHPAFYLNSILILLKGRDLDQIKERLEKQYEKLLSGSSFLQRMNASIQARSKCINKIRRDITKASKFLGLFQKEYFENTNEDAVYSEWVQAEGYSAVDVDDSIEHSIQLLSGIFTDMSRLRNMTIYIVESIHEWKMELEEHADRCQQHSPIYYLYQDKDVYQTILEDSNFIWKSKLSSYIWMEAKQDPFFIRNVIHIEQRDTKTPLQKYFLQILYPKDEITIQKSLKCFQMLFFKFKPKITNLFEEQEMLIQNYLKLQQQSHEFDEDYHSNRQPTQLNSSVVKVPSQEKDAKQSPSPQKKSRLNVRGWVFEKNQRSTNREKINHLVENHKQKMSIIRNFNIANYAQKNSIAFAYLSQKQSQKPQNWNNKIRINTSKINREKDFFSQNESNKPQKKQKNQVESEPQLRTVNESRMFKSLTKLHPVIVEDPTEHLPDTPKNKRSPQQNNKQHQANSNEIQRQPSLNHIKLNSFEPKAHEDEKIQVQQEETPLNIKQFFQVFRADTNKPRRKGLPEQNKEGEPQQVLSIKKFLQNARKQRAKSLYSRKPPLLQAKKRKQQDKKQQQINKSNDSYKQFTSVNNQGQTSTTGQKNNDFSNIFLSIKAKSIPFDLILPYVKHVVAQQHKTSHSFTEYKSQELLKKLSDPFIHCIIFDVFTEKQEHLGQVILSQSISGRGGKLKYTVEFMNINIFQLVISTILRVSEELLATSPCQQVVFPFIVNKMDIISTHFIELIDTSLKERVGKFGKLSIFQKPRPNLTGSDVRDRLYVFTSEANLKRQYELGLKMMGNYRSLQFQVKCLVLCSNFRLRSKFFFKDTLQKYRSVSLGELYVQIMSKILTKYHLKQLKAASYSIDSEDQLSQLLRKDVFVRNIMHNLMNYLKQERTEELLLMTVFDTMADLIHYLQYKKHDLHFNFQFLEESRFILNHEFILSEFDQDASLDFYLTSDNQIYVMHNYKKLPIIMLTSKNIPIPLYLLPSANEKIKIFIMSANDYESSTDQMDLFSYISYFFKQFHSQVSLNEVPAVVLPNLKQKRTRLSSVRMYDGFFKIFPEREFYSAARLTCFNHWESYYPNAVIHIPKETSIVIEFPFIVGFYDVKIKYPVTAFLYREDTQSS